MPGRKKETKSVAVKNTPTGNLDVTAKWKDVTDEQLKNAALKVNDGKGPRGRPGRNGYIRILEEKHFSPKKISELLKSPAESHKPATKAKAKAKEATRRSVGTKTTKSKAKEAVQEDEACPSSPDYSGMKVVDLKSLCRDKKKRKEISDDFDCNKAKKDAILAEFKKGIESKVEQVGNIADKANQTAKKAGNAAENSRRKSEKAKKTAEEANQTAKRAEKAAEKVAEEVENLKKSIEKSNRYSKDTIEALLEKIEKSNCTGRKPYYSLDDEDCVGAKRKGKAINHGGKMIHFSSEENQERFLELMKEHRATIQQKPSPAKPVKETTPSKPAQKTVGGKRGKNWWEKGCLNEKNKLDVKKNYCNLEGEAGVVKPLSGGLPKYHIEIGNRHIYSNDKEQLKKLITAAGLNVVIHGLTPAAEVEKTQTQNVVKEQTQNVVKKQRRGKEEEKEEEESSSSEEESSSSSEEVGEVEDSSSPSEEEEEEEVEEHHSQTEDELISNIRRKFAECLKSLDSSKR